MQWIGGRLSDYSDEQYDAVYRTLTPSRRKRIDRLRNPEDRRRSLLAEQLARQLLAQCGAQAAVVECDPDGAPYIRGASLYISITHSGQYAACAISDAPVGIDAETVRPVRATLIRRACTKTEYAYICGGVVLPEEVTDPAVLCRFFEMWTSKEAYYKKYRTGTLHTVDGTTVGGTFFHPDGHIVCVL